MLLIALLIKITLECDDVLSVAKPQFSVSGSTPIILASGNSIENHNNEIPMFAPQSIINAVLSAAIMELYLHIIFSNPASSLMANCLSVKIWLTIASSDEFNLYFMLSENVPYDTSLSPYFSLCALIFVVIDSDPGLLCFAVELCSFLPSLLIIVS